MNVKKKKLPVAFGKQDDPEPAYARQTEDRRPVCPRCQEKMTAVSTSSHVTHYQCKVDSCSERSVISIPRPLREPVPEPNQEANFAAREDMLE